VKRSVARFFCDSSACHIHYLNHEQSL